MSFRAVTWAFDLIRGLTANEKLLLLALAEFANDQNETWRSAQDLAARVECSPRTLKTHLKALEARGLIERSPRYSWCEDEVGACASRPPHKHRSGTTYLLRLDRTAPLPLASEVPLPRPPATSSQRDSARIVAAANQRDSLESQGNSHRGNFCTYEDDSPSTGANPGSPQVQPLAPVLKENPQLNPQPTHQPPSGGLVEDSQLRRRGAPPRAASPSSEDWRLIQACLPEHLHDLDAPGALRVAALLRERVEAGWEAIQIRRIMGQPLPPEVRRLSGVVVYRLQENVDPTCPPPPLGQAQAAQVVEPEPDPVDEAFSVWVWAPAFAKHREATGSWAKAGKAASAELVERGVDRDSWQALFDAAVADAPELDPTDPAQLQALAQLALGRAQAKGRVA